LIGIVSFISPPPSGEGLETTLWRRDVIRLPAEEVRDGYPWWRRVSLWFAFVVIIFIVIYTVFW
jgi:hypothetical protein